jgi:pseudo-response regulator 7
LIIYCKNAVPVKIAGSKHVNRLDVGPSKFNEQINRGQMDPNCENQSGKLRCKVLSLSDAVTSPSDSQMQSGEIEALNRRPNFSDIDNKGTNNDEELPSLELSLKRPRKVEEAGPAIQDERNILRRSDQSAFSRYGDLVLCLAF